MRALGSYSWPGNVRELQNVIERLVVTVHKSVIEVQDLPHEVSPGPPSRCVLAPIVAAASPTISTRAW